MAWPTTAVATTELDAVTDTPPRAEILKMAQNLNALQAHVSAAAQALLDDADQAAMRTTLAVYSKAEVDAALANAEAVGSIKMWPASTPPAGWLKRNGAALSRTTYAALFAVIGTTFGAGDGSTTFNLPDDRANVDRGWDDGRGVDAGRAFGSEQLGQNASHTHGVNDPSHAHYLTGTGGGGGGSGIQGNTSGGPIGATYTNNAYTGISIQAQGGTEARMRNRAYLPIIKY
jgi:microcystin-dependent protein